MERTVAVFHKGAVAHYNVSEKGDGTYTVRLLRYNGSEPNTPPQNFHLQKNGRHWQDDSVQQELVDEIGYAIELHKRDADQPIYQSFRGDDRKEGNGRP